MANNWSNRRRSYFIKKRFQTNFIVKFSILVIIGTIVSGAIIYSMSASTVTTTFEDSRLKIKSTAEFVLPAVLISGAVVIIFVGISAGALTLFTSHKIAGPIYRLEIDVKKLTTGNLKTRFRMREGDQLSAITGSLNEMVEFLRTNIADAKKGVSEVESIIESMDREGDVELARQLRDKLETVKASLEKFEG